MLVSSQPYSDVATSSTCKRDYKPTLDLRDLAQLSFQILSEEDDTCPSILALRPGSPLSLLNEETETTNVTFTKNPTTNNLQSSTSERVPSSTTIKTSSKSKTDKVKVTKNPLPVEPVKMKSSKRVKNWSAGMTGRVSWNERYLQLKEFKDRFGHCKVPYRWPENPPLGRWVGLMRKKKKEGTLDQQKIYALEILKFSWNLLGYKKRLRKEGSEADDNEDESDDQNDMDVEDENSEDQSSSGTDN
eukprot:TRINITY_DN14617_c0_g1_i1.p1 TRINITY_DN14617_c0_g1~~TRINITY_DN14617_c0_g1_i1.p1  ORF type:complete len:245 (+),score=66.82 TRINITY_DN14617_c0_g1_i1:254-988(+)